MNLTRPLQICIIYSIFNTLALSFFFLPEQFPFSLQKAEFGGAILGTALLLFSIGGCLTGITVTVCFCSSKKAILIAGILVLLSMLLLVRTELGYAA